MTLSVQRALSSLLLMIRIGCDVVYMPRLIKHIHNIHWLNKVLTSLELRQYQDLRTERRQLEFLSGRFASKEAYAKARGTGIGLVGFHDFEVLQADNGCPVSNQGQVSISHDGDYAFAVVIIDENT